MDNTGAGTMLSEQATGPDEARFAPRTNMFIAAVLRGPNGSCPVRIRNLSRSGALIEAPVLPPQGSAVQLVRSDFRVAGEIVWRAGSRCGLRLDSAIIVADWMANPANRHQGVVDTMVAKIKSELASAPAASAPPPPASSNLGQDINRLHLLLEAMSDDLTSVPETLMRHAASLQHLDIAGQMLDALKQAVDSNPDLRRVGLVRLHSLRRSGDAVLPRAA